MKIKKSVLKEIVREVIKEQRLSKPLSRDMQDVLKTMPSTFSEDQYLPMIVTYIEDIAAIQKQEGLMFAQAVKKWEGKTSGPGQMSKAGKKKLVQGLRDAREAYINIVKSIRPSH